MEISTKQLDHHGIVAATYDSLGIADVIDRRISKTKKHYLDHSMIVKAMVILGLGFVERRYTLLGSILRIGQ